MRPLGVQRKARAKRQAKNISRLEVTRFSAKGPRRMGDQHFQCGRILSGLVLYEVDGHVHE
jgi:hypothetical protein